MQNKKLVASLVLMLMVSIVVIYTVTAHAAEPQNHETITVRRGDTLWNIAKANRGKTEIRKYIYNLQQLNDIGSDIYPGQELLLP